MTAEYEDFLAHYGIKGQKWGLRRFQNEDGSLTEEGLARYQRASEAQNKPAGLRTKEDKKAINQFSQMRFRMNDKKYAQYLMRNNNGHIPNDAPLAFEAKYAGNKNTRKEAKKELDSAFDKEIRAYKSTRNNHTVRNSLAKVLGSVAVTASAGIGLGLLSRGDTKAGAATLVGAGVVAAMLPRKSRQNG